MQSNSSSNPSVPMNNNNNMTEYTSCSAANTTALSESHSTTTLSIDPARESQQSGSSHGKRPASLNGETPPQKRANESPINADEVPSRPSPEEHLDLDNNTSSDESPRQFSQHSLSSSRVVSAAAPVSPSALLLQSRGLLIARPDDPCSRASRIRRSNLAYTTNVPRTLPATGSGEGQPLSLLTIPREIRDIISNYAATQTIEADFCACHRDGITDCATGYNAISTLLFDQIPHVSLHQVNQQLRAETLNLVKTGRMKNINVCSPACLDAVLRQCNLEQLIRTQRIFVHIDNSYIAPPFTKLGWLINYSSIYKIHTAALEVAHCFARVESSTGFYDLCPEAVQNHVKNVAAPLVKLEIGLDHGSIYDSPAPFSSIPSADSAHITCYRDGRVRASPHIR